MKAYHISPRKIRKKILKEGLKPSLGPRSRRFGENEPKLFLTSDINDSIKLANIKFFHSHPDFVKGIDIWEVKISETIERTTDKRFDKGFYIKDGIKFQDLNLVKSLKWSEN